MDALWVLLITGAVMVSYTAVVVWASIRGRQWAIDTLKATSCLVEGPAAAAAWHTLEQGRQPAPGRGPDVECEITADSERVA